MKKLAVLLILPIAFFIILILAPNIRAELAQRFPQPEFGENYVMPQTVYPSPRGVTSEYADVAVFAGFLFAAAFFAIKIRSRPALYFTAVAAVVYFGFYRRGCICPIGAIQNVALSFSDPSYILPVSVLLFFSLPLVFALFSGRVFCSSVCPLGALQELVIFKPQKLPHILKHILGFFPYIFLSLAVVFTIGGSGFIICRFDPFVGFFRFGAPPIIFVSGVVLLLAGLYIARPYCRFICPYGVILGFFSYFSKKHLSITPDECIKCRLCEVSCPLDAINSPSPASSSVPGLSRKRKIGLYILLLPLLSLISGWGLSRASGLVAGSNRAVRIVREINAEPGRYPSDELQAFMQSDIPEDLLYEEALSAGRRFKTGLWFMGVFLGIIISVKILYALTRRSREYYEPDRFHCVSCGRCMEYCPVTENGNRSKRT